MRGQPVLLNGERMDANRTEAKFRAAFGPLDYWINVWLDKENVPHSESVFTVETEMLADINDPKSGWRYLHTHKCSKTYKPLCADCLVINLQEEADEYEAACEREADELQREADKLNRDWRDER